MRFDGKAGLVTGAGSGIGRATAIGFAQRGGAVAVADVNAGAANAVAAEIKGAGGSAIAITADLTKPTEIEAMIAGTIEAFGRLDMLHNNAFGVPSMVQQRRMARVAELDQEVWDHTLQVGLTAVMQATRRVLPVMQKQGSGAIVNTASISGLFGDYGIAAYNAMKAGVVNFTRVVAMEYAGDNIRCNCICPGAIDTPLLQRSLTTIQGFADATIAAIPMGRLGRPEEMANVVLFLASDLASYVTGAAFVADGGLTAKTGIPTRFTN
jgi:meso-butanediol dehydrogenase / (S,S)-butanediol dehydrogenase / diacetyl reductase